MRIGFLATEIDKGGAARAMQRSMKAMAMLGHEVVLIALSRDGASNGPVVHVSDKTPARIASRSDLAHWFYNGVYAGKNRNALSNTLFWVPSVGFELAGLLRRLSLDVINIHWTSYFLSMDSLRDILSLPAPTVFTLHDMAHFTGGCHYSAGCRRFETDCAPCGQLKWDPLRVPGHVRDQRQAIYAETKPWVVAPSHWLISEAKASGLFDPTRLRYVSNGLDLQTFQPVDRAAARAALGIDEDAHVIMFGAFDNVERRKGFDLLLESVSALMARAPFREWGEQGKLVVVGFGSNLPTIDIPGVKVKATGYISDDDELAMAYSACDVVALPSRQDNQPNVMIESLACGTPVVAFGIGGALDLIENGINGALAPPFDVEAFADGLAAVLLDAAADGAMRAKSRQSVETLVGLYDHGIALAKVMGEAVAARSGAAAGDLCRANKPSLPEAVQFPTFSHATFFGGALDRVTASALKALR
jgi:glycosyltransferase involved in cell wall biosynthesis